VEDSIAVQKFKSGYNCAQSVLFNYAEKLTVSADEIITNAQNQLC